MTRTSTQQFFVGPDNALLHVGFYIANRLKQGISWIRDFLRHQNLRTFCHNSLLLIKLYDIVSCSDIYRRTPKPCPVRGPAHERTCGAWHVSLYDHLSLWFRIVLENSPYSGRSLACGVLCRGWYRRS